MENFSQAPRGVEGSTLHGMARPQSLWQPQARPFMEGRAWYPVTSLLPVKPTRRIRGKKDPFFHAFTVHLTLSPSAGHSIWKGRLSSLQLIPRLIALKSHTLSTRLVEPRGAARVHRTGTVPAEEAQGVFRGKQFQNKGLGGGKEKR